MKEKNDRADTIKSPRKEVGERNDGSHEEDYCGDDPSVSPLTISSNMSSSNKHNATNSSHQHHHHQSPRRPTRRGSFRSSTVMGGSLTHRVEKDHYEDGNGSSSSSRRSRGRTTSSRVGTRLPDYHDDSLTTLGSMMMSPTQSSASPPPSPSPTNSKQQQQISFTSLPSMSSDHTKSTTITSSSRGAYSLQSFRGMSAAKRFASAVTKSRRRATGSRTKDKQKSKQEVATATTASRNKSSFAAWRESLSRASSDLPKEDNDDDVDLPDPRPILMAATQKKASHKHHPTTTTTITTSSKKSSSNANSHHSSKRRSGSAWRPSLPTLESERLLCQRETERKLESERRFSSTGMDAPLVHNSTDMDEGGAPRTAGDRPIPPPRPPLREISFRVVPEPLTTTATSSTCKSGGEDTDTMQPPPSPLGRFQRAISLSPAARKRGGLVRTISSHFQRRSSLSTPVVNQEEGPTVAVAHLQGNKKTKMTNHSFSSMGNNDLPPVSPRRPATNPRMLAQRRDAASSPSSTSTSSTSLRQKVLVSKARSKPPLILF